MTDLRQRFEELRSADHAGPAELDRLWAELSTTTVEELLGAWREATSRPATSRAGSSRRCGGTASGSRTLSGRCRWSAVTSRESSSTPTPRRRRRRGVALAGGLPGRGHRDHGLRPGAGGGASYSIDTTALPAVVLQAQHALGPKGVLVALGLGAAGCTIDAIDLLQAGRTVRSSVEGEVDPLVTIAEPIALRAAGRLEVDHLAATYPFDRIADAVAASASGKVVKPVLVW